MAAAAATENPMAKVISLMNDLKAKVKKDEAAEAKVYQEYYDWCQEVTGEKLHAIKLSEERKDQLKASIDKYFAEIEESGEEISDEAKAIAAAIAEGKDVKGLREKQHADFLVADKELTESIDMLSRAIAILERELEKGSSAFIQKVNVKMPEVLQVMNIITEAAAFSTSDKATLRSLLQQRQSAHDESNDDDAQPAAPAAAAYSSKSGSIVDTLEDMKDKAEKQLTELRQGEQQARHVFDKLVTALKAQRAADEKQMQDAKAEKTEAKEDEAEAETDLYETLKVLDVHSDAYRKTKAQCLQTASDHEAAVASRQEELKVIAEATEILETTTSDAAAAQYSFLQESSLQQVKLHSTSDLVNLEVITVLKNLAQQQHSAALTQLAKRINAVVRFGMGNKEDVFAKVKGLIKDLIAKLEKESKSDLTEEQYCDQQMKETSAKEESLEERLKKLSAAIDTKSAKSAQAKADVKEAQTELVKIAKEQAELDKIREDESAAFLETKADLEQGIKGIRQAVTMLREYYSAKDSAASPNDPADAETTFLQISRQPTPPDLTHRKSSDAAHGIIEILEMTESDFATSLAKEMSQESDSAREYEEATQENKVEKSTLDQEVKVKTKEFQSMDKRISEMSADRDSAASEQTSVLEYSAKLKDRCIAAPAAYEERKKRREAEIRGLREALEILKNEAAFMQRHHTSSRLRGASWTV